MSGLLDNLASFDDRFEIFEFFVERLDNLRLLFESDLNILLAPELARRLFASWLLRKLHERASNKEPGFGVLQVRLAEKLGSADFALLLLLLKFQIASVGLEDADDVQIRFF